MFIHGTSLAVDPWKIFRLSSDFDWGGSGDFASLKPLKNNNYNKVWSNKLALSVIKAQMANAVKHTWSWCREQGHLKQFAN